LIFTDTPTWIDWRGCGSCGDNITAYDAAYVALAEALGATVVTCDAPIARASGHRAHIDLIH